MLGLIGVRRQKLVCKYIEVWGRKDQETAEMDTTGRGHISVDVRSGNSRGREDGPSFS